MSPNNDDKVTQLDEPHRQDASLRSRDRVPRLPNRVVARTRTFSRGRRAHAGVDYGSPAGRYVRDVQCLVADMAFGPQTGYSPAARDRPHRLLALATFSPATPFHPDLDVVPAAFGALAM